MLRAAQEGILRYILIGHADEILSVGHSLGCEIDPATVINADTDEDAAHIAVELIREEQLQNIGIEDTGKLSAELLGYEADFTAPEDFQYDGQYRLFLSERLSPSTAETVVSNAPDEL